MYVPTGYLELFRLFGESNSTEAGIAWRSCLLPRICSERVSREGLENEVSVLARLYHIHPEKKPCQTSAEPSSFALSTLHVHRSVTAVIAFA